MFTWRLLDGDDGDDGSDGQVVTCSALVGKNVTNAPLEGCDNLSAFVGKEAVLHIAVDGSALLYMIGFGSK